jgi:hypothetical protein
MHTGAPGIVRHISSSNPTIDVVLHLLSGSGGVMMTSLALLPLQVVDLGELEIGGVDLGRVSPLFQGESGGFQWWEIYRQESSSVGVEGRKADLGVDVEETLLSARRPDGALDAKLIGLEVVVVKDTLQGEGRGDLRAFLSARAEPTPGPLHELTCLDWPEK